MYRLLFISYLFLLTACTERPIYIGFVGEITGRHSTENVAARNGIELAVDLINEQGGIHGKSIKLIIKNDKGDPELAQQVDTELINQGVVAIIGHMASQPTIAALPQINYSQTILFSPTVARLAGQKDYFFRAAPSIQQEAKAFPHYLYHDLGIRELVGIIDTNNRDYTEALWGDIYQDFRKLGGEIKHSLYILHDDLKTFIAESGLDRLQPEAIMFLSSANDVALLAQFARQQGIQSQFFAPVSAHNQDLILKGGRAVENMQVLSIYNPNNPYHNFQLFSQQYQKRYRQNPSYGAAYGFETVTILAHALRQTHGQSQGLPQALLGIKKLPAIQGNISIDAYGDIQRDLYIMQVKNGQFKLVHTVSGS
ncbi:ABC transporter substrate-binding protein [Candidatus Albibeggiatoa sp. nov. NOAA]|uniref:ABC transporter substrate-binding protein n=1 Tax=Candidatus Albibeggiatoa sp. nov. NOAA TaxID=3162724 RepID=UPI0032F67C75|nr:ABC transporter substrate-binding protein [Thiotrichaceae bacterium]